MQKCRGRAPVSLPKFLFGHTRVLVYVRELYVSSLYIRSPVRTTFSGRIIGYYFPPSLEDTPWFDQGVSWFDLKELVLCTVAVRTANTVCGASERSLGIQVSHP